MGHYVGQNEGVLSSLRDPAADYLVRPVALPVGIDRTTRPGLMHQQDDGESGRQHGRPVGDFLRLVCAVFQYEDQ